MTKAIKRSFGVIMSFLLVLAIICSVNLHTSAAMVDYVYAEGKFIKNWGIREQIATFLSPNAEAFYQKNNTSFEALSAFSGAANTNNVTSSKLYQELHNLMEKNHTFITDYGYTRYKFQYTDIQNSGKTSNKISSFYSGKEIGPRWDSGDTWNREHTWPNSKGEGDGENDIMMLRPTAKSENGSRGNTAYGKSSGYYNPNRESADKHDLRGDVARIVLYQHVRWQQNRLFGSSGVIESKAVLLEWMQADPVDTWELGRNDSVQSITGTRNVFVDYPELAFLLFGEQIPANYQTPSGIANNGAVSVPTPDNNNNQNNTHNNDQQNDNQNDSQDNSSNQTENDYQSNPQDQYQVPAYDLDYCSHKNAVKVEAENPRCETEGFTEGTYCQSCKEYIKGHQPVEATGHEYSGDCDADCNTCGSIRETTEDIAHNIENGVCAVCGIENKDESTSEEQEVDNVLEDENKPKRSFAWIIVAGGVLVVGTGAALVYIYRDKIWPKEIE